MSVLCAVSAARCLRVLFRAYDKLFPQSPDDVCLGIKILHSVKTSCSSLRPSLLGDKNVITVSTLKEFTIQRGDGHRGNSCHVNGVPCAWVRTRGRSGRVGGSSLQEAGLELRFQDPVGVSQTDPGEKGWQGWAGCEVLQFSLFRQLPALQYF